MCCLVVAVACGVNDYVLYLCVFVATLDVASVVSVKVASVVLMFDCCRHCM